MRNLKLNKKGFTLIELLAVIVVLAIIIVIAVPSVLNIQKNAKIGTAKDEALLLIKSIETCMASEQETSDCGPADLHTATVKYYEKDKDATALANVSSGSNSFYYEFDSGNAETYKLKSFKFSSNGYLVEYTGDAISTSDLKTMIQEENASISIH